MVNITDGPEIVSVHGQSVFTIYSKDGGIRVNPACFVVIQTKDDLPILMSNGWEPFGET